MCIILKQPHINWLREPDRIPEEETMVEPLDEQILDESLLQPVPKSLVKTRTDGTAKPILHNIFL